MNKESRNRIKAAVLKTLDAYGKKVILPVPIKAITKKSFPNVRLVPYSTLMARRGLTYEEMIFFAMARTVTNGKGTTIESCLTSGGFPSSSLVSIFIK